MQSSLDTVILAVDGKISCREAECLVLDSITFPIISIVGNNMYDSSILSESNKDIVLPALQYGVPMP